MMAPRIYVAGSSRELERAERVIAEARKRGLVVTQDWPAAVRAAGASNHGLTHLQRLEAARERKRGVHTADVLLLLVPHDEHGRTIGAWVELGYAMARGVRLFASAWDLAACHSTVFLALPEVTVIPTDDGALEAITAETMR